MTGPEVQNLTEQVRDLVVEVINELHVAQLVYGTITAHTSGPSSVSFQQGGTAARSGIRYYSGYTPTVGDTVVAIRAGTDLFVLGTIQP
jgi:hypothetical protein